MGLGSVPKKAAVALGDYLRRHPEEVVRAARNALSLKLGVPVRALQWLAQELGGDKLPKDLQVEARNPGLYLSASFRLMNTPVKGGANVIIERIQTGPDAMLVDVRLEDIQLKVTDPLAGTPVAALLQSGALDLSRPGDLLAYFPTRPEMVVQARGNLLTLDLMKHPKLSAQRARRLVAVAAAILGIDEVRTQGQHLDVAFAAFPGGTAAAVDQIRHLF
jgi:hypothetical protein